VIVRPQPVPQNIVRPSTPPPVQIPRNTITKPPAPKPQAPLNGAFTAALTDEQAFARDETKGELSELIEDLADDAIDEIDGKIGRNIEETVEALEDLKKGDPSKLKELLKNGEVTQVVKEKAEAALAAHEAAVGIENGATQGFVDGKIDQIEDTLNDLPDGDKFKDQFNHVENANDYTKIVDLITRGGTPGGGGVGPVGFGGGGQGGIAIDHIDWSRLPDNSLLVYGATAPAPQGTGKPIQISNPAANGATISYVISGHQFKMDAGQSQKLEDKNWVIEFHKGGNLGNARFSLRPGYYEFTMGENGWEFFRKTQVVVIDNSAYAGDFNYLLNGETQTVGGLDIKQHEVGGTAIIEFDAGDGRKSITRELRGGETYRIGVDVRTGKLDIFPASF